MLGALAQPRSSSVCSVSVGQLVRSVMQRSFYGVRLLNRVALVLAASLAFSLAAPLLRAQPVNDDFGNATSLSGPSGVVSGSNIGATLESGEPNITGNAGGQSVWYAWTPLTDMTITFTTLGSDFDTLLGVYTGPSVDALTLVA